MHTFTPRHKYQFDTNTNLTQIHAFLYDQGSKSISWFNLKQIGKCKMHLQKSIALNQTEVLLLSSENNKMLGEDTVSSD